MITQENTQHPLCLESHVPDMEIDLYDPQQDAIVEERMSDYRGKRLVLFFYPADFTFVCPTELKDLYAHHAKIREHNADVLVVSVDSVFSHKRWVETEQLLQSFNIKMVSDRKGHISKMFGVMNEQTGNSERATFIISPDGYIKSIEVVTEPIGRSSVELVRKVQALEYVRTHEGHACPSSRNVGDKTLQPSIDIVGDAQKGML